MPEVSILARSTHPSHDSTQGSNPEKGTTRERLLQSAGPVFAARGFEAATVRELAAVAKVNIAAVGYHFGDKLGLYREVIESLQKACDERFPQPNNTESDPQKRLTQTVKNFLCRSSGQSGWETQLLMREIQQPTPVFDHIVRVIFRPQFEHLISNLEEMSSSKLLRFQYEQLALGIIGQCIYFATGTGMIQILISEENWREHFDIESLTEHIVAHTTKTLRFHENETEH